MLASLENAETEINELATFAPDKNENAEILYKLAYFYDGKN